MPDLQENLTIPTIYLSADHWHFIQSQAEEIATQEVCGLLFGTRHQNTWQVTEVRPVDNILKSPTQYRMDAEQQIKIFLDMEEQGLELLGIYHSHPAGPDRPSTSDMEQAYYPETAYLILFPLSGTWQVKGFLIHHNRYTQVKIEINGSTTGTG